MEVHELLAALHTAARLKDVVRHCDTAGGQRESVAEHSWRMTLMAYFMKDSFPDADMDKVMRMCVIHDLGEIFTGDIPVFRKTEADEKVEEERLFSWVASLPEPFRTDMRALYDEMAARETLEAKIYKAIDSMEAVISHNEADIATWEPHEYDLQLTYAWDRVAFSPYMMELRELIRQESLEKIERENPQARK